MATGRHRKPSRRALARSGKHRRPSRVAPRAAALVTVPAVLCGGTAAWAFWSATGSGSASVSTTSAQTLTVTAGSSAPETLYPGKPSVSLPVTVTNPNGYRVSLTKLTAVTPASSNPSCPASNIAVDQAVVDAMAAGGHTVPAITINGGGNAQAVLANLISLKSSAPNECQGLSFTIGLSFTGMQV